MRETNSKMKQRTYLGLVITKPRWQQVVSKLLQNGSSKGPVTSHIYIYINIYIYIYNMCVWVYILMCCFSHKLLLDIVENQPCPSQTGTSSVKATGQQVWTHCSPGDVKRKCWWFVHTWCGVRNLNSPALLISACRRNRTPGRKRVCVIVCTSTRICIILPKRTCF